MEPAKVDRAAVRRRRVALAALAFAALVGGVVAGSRGGAGTTDDIATATRPPGCPASVAARPRRLVGQMLIVRMEDTATTRLRQRIFDGEIGGAVLFPPEGMRPEDLADQVRALRAAAARGKSPRALVAIDQEGGEIKRLPDLPPNRSPAEIAAKGESAARAQGAATGSALRKLGIDVDLAPVVDVPAVAGAFIGSRAFSDDPGQVAALGTAFGVALQGQGVAATAKHFPGLGLATDNTDLAPSAIDAQRDELAAGLEPFSAAIDAGFDLVMVSNATYPALDPRHPASQSSRIVDGLLRGQLGYEGVVITDDLGAGALTGAGLDEGEAAVAAASAGADLLLVALTDGTAASEALIGAVRGGELDRDALIESCARTTALRRLLGAG